MKKFSLRKLLPKYLFEQKDDDDEEDIESPELPGKEYKGEEEPEEKPQPSIKQYIDKDDPTTKVDSPLDKKTSGKREKEEADYVTVGKKMQKDVAVHGYVLNKGPRPYTLEFEVFFYFKPTKQFVDKHRPVQYKRDRYKDYLEAPENVIAFLHDVEKRFGKSFVFDQVEKLKKIIEKNPIFFRTYPAWDWGEPKIAYYDQQHPRSSFIKGSEESEDEPSGFASHKSFQTGEETFHKGGYVIRFELLKKIETTEQINKLVSWKAENFIKGLLELPAFKSDENFTLKPGRIE